MIDETGRVAGRGAYLCRDAGCWTTALGRGAIGRALGAPLPAELRDALRATAAIMTTTDEGGAGGTKKERHARQARPEEAAAA